MTRGLAHNARPEPGNKNILVIGDYLPTPEWDGGSLRMLHLLKIFEGFFAKVSYTPRLAGIPHQGLSSEMASQFLMDQGVQIPGGKQPELALQHLQAQGNHYDVVLMCGAYCASEFIQSIRNYAPRALIVFDTVDLHHLRAFREAKIKRNRAQLQHAIQLKKNELNTTKLADCTFVVTEREKNILESECPGKKIFVLSNVHPVTGSARSFSERTDLVFIGAFNHTPNLDAAFYLIREIFPSIQQVIPGIRLFLVGSDPSEELKALSSEDIVVTGHVDKLDPYLNRCRLSLAPLRYGAGIKGKLLASMSFGLPVVASSIAAEGMDLRDGENFLLADTVPEICDRISQLYFDETLWNRISKNGIRFVQDRFSIDAAKEIVETIFRQMGIFEDRAPRNF